MKLLPSLLLLILMAITACAPVDDMPVTPAPPSPTIVAATATPKPTPIPPPSPTATRTPFPASVGPAAVAPVDTPAPPQAEVIAPALNVRTGPGLAYPTLGAVAAGDVLAVTGINPAGDWLEIDYKGQSGWISAQPQYVRRGEGADLPVRQAAPPPAEAAPTAAVPSGRGRLIIATSSGGELLAIDLDGGGIQKLAEGVIDPAVSPDGKHVAFTRWDGAELGALSVLDVETGAERVVLGDITRPKAPVWSADGGKIALSFQHGGVINPQRQCRKFAADEQIRIPANSRILWVGLQPDGRLKVCFIRNEDLHWFLRLVDPATGVFEDLPSDRYAYSPTWNPQNNWQVIYNGDEGLMQFDVTTRQQWPITTDRADTEPVFSPDGQRLAITYKQHDHWEIHTLDLATGARQRLTKPPLLAPQYNSAAPAWSPDGREIAFVTDRAGRWEIWVMEADGGNPRPLLPPEVQAQLSLQYHGVNERLINWLR